MHANPELAFEERHAHAALTDFLAERGFAVERGAFGLETGFRATAGSGGPTIAVLCEYDALPGVGHACGHNLIAEAGIAVGLGLEAALREGGGTVVVLGAPAEESGGGKIELIRSGAFEGVDAAMMLHPTGGANVAPGRTLSRPRYIAIHGLRVEYFGRSAHAAAGPWQGLNALDAVIHAFNGISLLRQQLRPTARVHGVITKGGDAPNVIPDHTAAHFYVREETQARLEALEPRVLACFEAAALATGCRLEHHWDGHPYSDLLTSGPIAEAYERHADALGLDVGREPRQVGASTDMGNVSYTVPAIHPSFTIEAESSNHTPGFTAAAGSEDAHARTLLAAKALCLTALELYADPERLAAAKREFETREDRRGG